MLYTVPPPWVVERLDIVEDEDGKLSVAPGGENENDLVQVGIVFEGAPERALSQHCRSIFPPG